MSRGKIPLLRIAELSVRVEQKTVLEDLDFQIAAGQVVGLMGPNGSGKSSLAMTLVGAAAYSVQRTAKSKIELAGQNILEMSIDERARKGLFLAYQNPVVIPGVTIFNLCKIGYEAQGKQIDSVVTFKRELEAIAQRVGLTKEHIGRNINEGFSGGEKKRLELLQLLLLQPKLAILDEIDSGLDVDGLKMVGEIVEEMRKKGTAFVLITHYQRLLSYVKVDRVDLMKAGRIVKSGGKELVGEIEEKGYGYVRTGV